MQKQSHKITAKYVSEIEDQIHAPFVVGIPPTTLVFAAIEAVTD